MTRKATFAGSWRKIITALGPEAPLRAGAAAPAAPTLRAIAQDWPLALVQWLPELFTEPWTVLLE